MHPHRQTFQHPRPAHPHSNAQHHKYFSAHKNHTAVNLPSASTLAALTAQFQTNNIRINCKHKLTIIIEKNNTRKHNALLSERKRKKKIGIFAGGGAKATLQSCLQKYIHESDAEYVLTSTLHHNYEQFRPHAKTIFTKSRTNSETSIGQPHSNKKISQKHFANTLSNRMIEGQQSEYKALKAYGSEKKIDQDMFVVEENAGESLASEPRESLKTREALVSAKQPQEHHEGDLQVNLNGITLKYLQKAVAEPAHSNSTKPAALQTQKEPTQKENVNEINKRNCQAVPAYPQEHGEKFKDNPKFSFAKGMIIHESIKLPKEESFKLPNNTNEPQKRLTQEVMAPNDASLADLSSIVSSNLREETKNLLELDSIKNQIEKISNCAPASLIVPPQIPLVHNQKIEVKLLSEQHEQNVKECVQIQEKPLQSNRSEFYVRYNFQGKTGPTEVIRISPLKFRKKDEVVKQFVKAKIVPKESNSINIP